MDTGSGARRLADSPSRPLHLAIRYTALKGGQSLE
jgi:hypothetical protein